LCLCIAAYVYRHNHQFISVYIYGIVYIQLGGMFYMCHDLFAIR
jgi:hypothetical protein